MLLVIVSLGVMKPSTWTHFIMGGDLCAGYGNTPNPVDSAPLPMDPAAVQ
jgi:hypothetical protein